MLSLNQWIKIISVNYKYHWYKYTLMAIFSVYSPPYESYQHKHQQIKNPIMLMSRKYIWLKEMEYDEFTVVIYL